MNKLTVSFLIVSILVFPAAAFADETDELLERLKPYIKAPRYLDEQGWSENDRFDEDPTKCLPIVDALRAAGVADNDRFAGYMAETWRFKQAPELCERYRTYQLKVRAGLIVDGVAGFLARGDGGGDDAHYAREHTQKCVTGLDKLIAEGLPTDAMVYAGREKEMQVAEARSTCAAIAARADKLANNLDKESAARTQAELAKWTKLGVAGKRLEVLSMHDSYYIKGCELTDDPRKLAKAKVLRLILRPEHGLTIFVRSYFFKGNALVKTTEVTWDSRDMRAACK